MALDRISIHYWAGHSMSKYHRQKNMRKARKKFKNVVLCSRDLRIMCLLFESKIASQEQIADYLFPDVSAQTVNRRLLKIMELGLIRRKPIAVDNKIIYAYSLTQRGLTKIQLTLSCRVKTAGTLSECPLHDIALNDIRKAFEAKSAVQRYYSENVLQSCDEYRDDRKFRPFIKLNSDAMAEVDTRIGVLNLAIEFDTTHKSKSRYLRKLNTYYVEQGVDGVLYICANKYILNVLLKVDREVSDRYQCDPKVYFALLENITGAAGELTFRSVHKGIFCVG